MSYVTIRGRMESMLAGRCPECGGALVEVDTGDEEAASVEAFCSRCDWRGMFGWGGPETAS